MGVLPHDPRKESLRINKLQSANAKEQLAIKILKVSGVSEGQINRIMQNPDAKFAIVKRAEKAFENLGVNLEEMNVIGIDETLKNIDNKALQGEVEKQSKELVAQVGRVASMSIDGQDMREKENLHEKYQAKANKMDGATFDKNAEKALEYEKTKDERGTGETLAYNLYRKPADLLNKLFTADKPIFTPGRTALVGLVALATMPPPAGAIVCAYLMCKAIKNQFYDGSKLEEWVNEKFYNKPPQKFDSQELEQVTVKGLSQDVKAQYSTVNQEQQRGEELDRRVSKEVAMAGDRGQSVQEVRDKARDIAGAMRDQGVGASAMPLPLDDSASLLQMATRQFTRQLGTTTP